MATFPYGPLNPATAVVSSLFGSAEAFRGKPHGGMDFAVPEGTPVYAVADGRVQASKLDDGGGGEYIRLRHTALNLDTQYLHLSRRDVEPGQFVLAGSQIGLSGNTGRSSGPHLHFDVRPAPSYERVDPAPYLPVPYRLKEGLAREAGFAAVGGGAAVGLTLVAVAAVGLWWLGRQGILQLS